MSIGTSAILAVVNAKRRSRSSAFCSPCGVSGREKGALSVHSMKLVLKAVACINGVGDTAFRAIIDNLAVGKDHS